MKMSAQGFGIHRSLQIGYFGQTLVCFMLDYKEFFLYKLASLRKNYPICRQLWISNPRLILNAMCCNITFNFVGSDWRRRSQKTRRNSFDASDEAVRSWTGKDRPLMTSFCQDVDQGWTFTISTQNFDALCLTKMPTSDPNKKRVNT